MNESNPKMLLQLAKEAHENKEDEKANKYLTELFKTDSAFADAYHFQGMLSYEQGELEEATKHFQKALEINPSYIDAALHLAILLSDNGDYEEAEKIYQRIQTIRQEHDKLDTNEDKLDIYLKNKITNLYASIGDIYADSFLYQKAAAEYQRALEISPHFPDIRLKLANSYRECKDYDKALEEYEKLKDSQPNYLPTLNAMGVLFYTQGQFERAKTIWEEALKLAPNNERTILYLKSLEKTSQSKLKQATEKDDSQEWNADKILKEK